MSKYKAKDDKRQCKQCGTVLSGRRRKYCSDECRFESDRIQKRKKYRLENNITTRNCPVCNKEFEPNKNGAKYKYCSTDCYKEQRKKRNRERWREENPGWQDDTVKQCEWCNSDYTVPGRNAHQARFCSDKCNDTWWSREVYGHLPLEERNAIRTKSKEKRLARLKQEQHQRYLERLTVKECEWCGSNYETDILNQKTCSKECRRKRRNHRSSLIKDERIPKSQIVDRDISLERLYKRDKGICYLCNEKCDYSDIKITKDGHKYAGGTYPSTDHVMPVTHGGLHAWSNVRLAHHRCNTIKSDTIPDDLKELLPKNAYSVARRVKARMKETLQFDLDGNLIATYESTAQAERETGFKRRGIQNNARGETKTYKGYKWEYV